MPERTQILNRIYSKYDEESRLVKSRAGELEFYTTMKYIHELFPAGSKLLETGAGTGRYSVRLAKEGYDVTAVELVEKNLELLKKNGAGVKNLIAVQGDATKLPFAECTFDGVLCLGPMYHLYEADEINLAIDEALRVTKTGGVLFFAFLSVYALLLNNFMKNNFEAGYNEYFTEGGTVRHFAEQGFTGWNIDEFEALFSGKNVQHLKTVSVDGNLELAEKIADFKMTDHHFKKFCKYHLENCEKRELLGASSHLLYVCKKM